MEDRFRTVTGEGRAAVEMGGSEFVGYAGPAQSVEDAEAFIAELEEVHPDATHVIPAYRVRDGDLLREYASDDGEPSGSAGKPTLNLLVQRELENVVVGIVRYYGGTNLGVGGLARAYARAAAEAADDAGVVDEVPHETLSATVHYDDSGTVRGVLESAGVEFEADYGERVRFEVWIPRDRADTLRDRLRSATSGRVELDEG